MRPKRKSNDVVPLIVAILVILIAVYFGYVFIINKEDPAPTDQETTENTEDQASNEDSDPTIITLEETPEKEGGHYIKKVPMIDRQQTYITIPTTYEEGTPPTIIVYSHGQDQEITVYETEEFMQQMVAYGEFFTKHNYIFAASNMHDDNWGSDEAIQDMNNMIEWIETRYKTKNKVNLLGFSMGGRPTFEFAFVYPDKVEKIASLAGSTRSESWTDEELLKLTEIDVKIWHGDEDVNVLYRYSTSLVERCEDLDIEIELRTIEGVGHWDIDWEYHEEILTFFEA